LRAPFLKTPSSSIQSTGNPRLVGIQGPLQTTLPAQAGFNACTFEIPGWLQKVRASAAEGIAPHGYAAQMLAPRIGTTFEGVNDARA
jgi:hypothetical protein